LLLVFSGCVSALNSIQYFTSVNTVTGRASMCKMTCCYYYTQTFSLKRQTTSYAGAQEIAINQYVCMCALLLYWLLCWLYL